ncbi:MAG TPA: ammonium transporter [Lentisphaeria bacterium]|nr:ammonium transporter [Lentisphaeria bacterium]
MKFNRWITVTALFCLLAGTALAQEAPPAVDAAVAAVEGLSEEAQGLADFATRKTEAEAQLVTRGEFVANNVWMMVCAALVFIMHLGFSCLETGLTRAKNTTNILFKNVCIVAIGILTYALIGFNLMYPGGDSAGAWFGFAGFFLDTANADVTAGYYNGAYTYWTDFLFQAMFAATAATIISGAVAERVKLSTFLIFTTLYVAICYPIVGMWKWGGGWLDAAGFYDFAGSTIVHSVGGWGALVCAWMLGPRIGKYVGGQSRPIMGHNLPLATIGMFLLWLGWFGFNGGSVLSAEPGATSLVLVTTSLAAAAGVVSAMVASWIVQKTPDLTMILNGALAGLVGVTAGADQVSPTAAIIIGLVSGVLVFFSVLGIDRILKIDDPVGAISVHLVCGMWGTLAVGIFNSNFSVFTQLKGIIATAVFCVTFSVIVFGLLKILIGIRVSEKEELRGLDISEHAMESYGGFQIFTTQ